MTERAHRRARRECAALLLVTLLAAACAPTPVRPVRSPTYVVHAGDTVYSIATRHGLDYHALARWNHLGPDFAIHVGDVLVLGPGDGAPVPAVRPAPVASPAQVPAAADDVAPAFVWPAEGTATGLVERPAGGFGLNVEGVRGTPVRAAAAGRVVYLGTGLKAYGLLVIVRHGEHYLTAYGNAESATVAEGAEVAGGAQIATMGEVAPGRAALYFEIRHDGRPVNPLKLLPPR